MSGAHADLATLLAYWQRDLGESESAALEEHYLGCELCSGRLAEIETLARGVKDAFAGGRVATVITPAFAEGLRAAGVRLREYHVPCNGSVNCSVAPGDQFLLAWLTAPLQGVERVDAVVIHEGEHRLEDVPFDAVAGQVVVAPPIELIRKLPAHRQSMRLVAVGAGGDRVLGEYTFNHSPHV
jgi:hypothetical protein